MGGGSTQKFRNVMFHQVDNSSVQSQGSVQILMLRTQRHNITHVQPISLWRDDHANVIMENSFPVLHHIDIPLSREEPGADNQVTSILAHIHD